MNKERLVVLLLCLAAILTVMIVGMSLATDRGREVAVAKLRAKGAALKDRSPARKGASIPEKKDVVPEPAGASPNKAAPAEEETLAAFTRLVKREKTFEDGAPWKDVFDTCIKRPDQWTEAERTQLSAFLAANRDMILDLRRLAESGGPLYQLDCTTEWGRPLPHLMPLRTFARMLAADAAISSGAGNYAEAVDDLIAGMKLAHTLDGESITNSQLARAYMDEVVSDAIEGGIRGEALPPDQCARLIECLSHTANRQAFADSITAEGIVGLNLIDGIRTGDTRDIDFGAESWGPILVRAYGSPLARPWLNADEETYADIVGRIADAARLPYYEAKPIIDEIDAEVANMPRTRALARRLAFDLDGMIFIASQAETRMDLTCIGLAIEQYHAQHGTYPDSLDLIAPALGGAVPTDPLTGQPYVYQPSGGHFALYSAYVPPPPPPGEYPPQHFPGTDANARFSWRGPQWHRVRGAAQD